MNNHGFIEFPTLKKNLRKDFSGFSVIRMAVLGDTATQFLVQAIRGYGYEFGLDCRIYESDYDQIDYQITQAGSELHAFAPEVVLLFFSLPGLVNRFARFEPKARMSFFRVELDRISFLVRTLSENLNCRCILCNFPEPEDGIFGNYGNKTDQSLLYQVRSINMGMMDLAREEGNVFILDLSAIQNTIGRKLMTEPKLFASMQIWTSFDLLPIMAKRFLEIVQAFRGKFRKCLVLDLDNTLWGGIMGEDGIEGIQIGHFGVGEVYSGIQQWAKMLKERGIILAICSKNDEQIASEPFERHPDMVLRLEDISVFVANWNTKVDNIHFIRDTLNISFESMVFVDDNPFERNMVRQYIPEIAVPELPEDPAEYLPYLCSLNLFETTSFSEEDGQRTLQYQEESKRNAVRRQFSNENDFLESLSMISFVEGLTSFNIPRAAQLSQRSNQFNLRTIRYTEEDLKQMAADPRYTPLVFSLKDRFGDYGIIGLIILFQDSELRMFIDTWLMSCRVLKRGMEHFMLNTLVEEAKKREVRVVEGEYIPSGKNTLVANHFIDLGFTPFEAVWRLDVALFSPKKNHISHKFTDG